MIRSLLRVEETIGGSHLSAEERQTLLDTAEDAAHAAEAVLETACGGDTRLLSWLGRDLMVELARLCEDVVLDRIRDRFPDDSVLSGESGLLSGGSKRTWIVDPLDGTKSLSISIACVSRRPEQLHLSWKTGMEAAVVSLLPQEEIFMAVRGGGATCNGLPLTLRVHEASVFSRREPPARHSRKAGSPGTLAGELAFLAAGRLGGIAQKDASLWDFAAAGLLIAEAGGRIDAKELAPGRWSVIAGEPAHFDRMDAPARLRY